MAKSAYLHMRVTPELKDAVHAAAKARFIDVSALVSLVLADWLERTAKARVELSEGRATEEEIPPAAVDVRPPVHDAPEPKKRR